MLQHYLSLNPAYEVRRFDFSTKIFFSGTTRRPAGWTRLFIARLRRRRGIEKDKGYNKDIEVIIISGQEDVATAINC